MIIQDLDFGDDLKLLKDRLVETIGHQSGYPFYVLFSDIRQAVKSDSAAIQVHGRSLSGSPNHPYVAFSSLNQRIGCRTFSPETFTKILKAAGVKVARKKGKK